MANTVNLRRVADGPRSIGSGFRHVRRYEFSDSTGVPRLVTLHELGSLLNSRALPADFWACVAAADTAFSSGDVQAYFQWPTGQRVAHD
jgi:hypothetical protein